MDLTNYAFATYVFILVCACIWMLGRMMKKSKKANGSEKKSYDKEQKLFTLYQNVEDMLAGFEEYVEESKGEADKSMGEMRKMLEEVKILAAELKDSGAPVIVKEPEMITSPEKQEERVIERMGSLHIVTPRPFMMSDEPRRSSPIPRVSKTGSKVLELQANGMDQNEIAKELGISVREVTLAMKIASAGDKK